MRTAITDPTRTIRKTVLLSLSPKLDMILGQREYIDILFTAMRDEIFTIRELATSILCRLSALNPGAIIPHFRDHLLELIDLIQYSNSNVKYQYCIIAGMILSVSYTFITPYASIVYEVLVSAVKDTDTAASMHALSALEQLIITCWDHLQDKVDSLIGTVIDALKGLGLQWILTLDRSSPMKRLNALSMLRTVIDKSGYVIQPFKQFPMLLDLLLDMLKTEVLTDVRAEVIKLFGLLGALDPYSHSKNTDRTSRNTLELHGLTPSDRDYYAKYSFKYLISIFTDSSLSNMHITVLSIMAVIFDGLGAKSIIFLPELVPVFLNFLSTDENISCKTKVFDNIGLLVEIVRQHIRPFVDGIMEAIEINWSNHVKDSLVLIAKLGKTLKFDFQPYVQRSVLLISKQLDLDNSQDITCQLIETIAELGQLVSTNLHILMPYLVRYVCDTQERTCIRALSCLSTLSQCCDIQPYTSRIIHTIVRLLDSENLKLQTEGMKTLSSLAIGIGPNYLPWVSLIKRSLIANKIENPQYNQIVSELEQNRSVQSGIQESFIDPPPSKNPDYSPPSGMDTKYFELVWNGAKSENTADDWREWIESITVLILQSWYEC